MRDYKSIDELRKEYSNLNDYISSLCEVINQLENKIKHYEEGTATVYSPNQSSYKDLELKLKNFETNKQKDIDELFETRITPLNKKVMELTQELSTSVDINLSQKSKIRELEIVRDNLNTMIDFAVGYISATQPHTDKHPMEVKEWLFKGWEGLQ
jgi:predicted transcriptional regulator